jgi:hypothetical protein
MKPLERIFFMACINECLYQSYGKYGMSIYYIIEIFQRLGFSEKQLVYYLKKWSNRGFYDYGVNICFGFFVFDKLKGEYKEIYESEKGKEISRNFKQFEFARDMVRAEIGYSTITNAALKRFLGIEDDDSFYGGD